VKLLALAVLALAWLAVCGWYRLCREMRAASEAIHE